MRAGCLTWAVVFVHALLPDGPASQGALGDLELVTQTSADNVGGQSMHTR